MSATQNTHGHQVGRQAEEENDIATQKVDVDAKNVIEIRMAEKDMTDDDIFDAEGRQKMCT